MDDGGRHGLASPYIQCSVVEKGQLMARIAAHLVVGRARFRCLMNSLCLRACAAHRQCLRLCLNTQAPACVFSISLHFVSPSRDDDKLCNIAWKRIKMLKERSPPGTT